MIRGFLWLITAAAVTAGSNHSCSRYILTKVLQGVIRGAVAGATAQFLSTHVVVNEGQGVP